MTSGSISYGSHLGQERCVVWRYWAPKPPLWCICTVSCKASPPLFWVVSAVVIPVTCNSNQISLLAQAGLLLGRVTGRKGCLFPIQPLSQWKPKDWGWAEQDCGHCLLLEHVVSNIWEERGRNVLFQELMQGGTIFPQHLQCSAGVLNANLWLSFA